MQTNTSSTSKKIIAVISANPTLLQRINECNIPLHEAIVFKSGYDLYSRWNNEKLNISIVITYGEIMGAAGIHLFDNLMEKGVPSVPFLICATDSNENLIKLSLRSGVADVFKGVPAVQTLEMRICFLIDNWSVLTKNAISLTKKQYRIDFWKRLFDVVFASMALLLLSPLFLLVAILLKIESKGPVFYYAFRVGTGYRFFKFYKFRSMYVNADQKLKELKHLNQYNNQDKSKESAQPQKNSLTLCSSCAAMGDQCRSLIYADKMQWCEKQYVNYMKLNGGSAFVKIKDDPRITKVGNVIRNLSIDELPQLWNVVIGDMSIVGNRPLPLYEAEKLTTDKYALRFMAPAGMTGLWQVEKRGKGEMSEEERLMLDNAYAKDHNLIKDIKLILKTVPALFQKENV